MPATVPDSLADALSVLAARPETTVLAGGTDLMVEINDGRRPVDDVVVVSRIPELSGVRADGAELVIGAATRFAAIEHGVVAELAPALAYAARTVGSPQIRNAATIGGNLSTAPSAGDALPVLLALGATIDLANATRRRSVAARDFFTGPKRSVLQPGELVVAVRMPVRRGRQEYLKVGVRNAMVIAVASLALVVDFDERSVSVGLGSVGPTPLDAPDAGAWIAERAHWRDDGFDVTDDDAGEFGARVGAAARPIDDHRGTAAYRRHAIEVVARRALVRCAA